VELLSTTGASTSALLFIFSFSSSSLWCLRIVSSSEVKASYNIEMASPIASQALKARVRRTSLWNKVAHPEDLIKYFPNGSYIGWSGFTGVGYPKYVCAPFMVILKLEICNWVGERKGNCLHRAIVVVLWGRIVENGGSEHAADNNAGRSQLCSRTMSSRITSRES
jgi:hypothetical protein